MYNVGFNCIAAQVLILPEKWELKDKFLDAIRDVLRKLPAREPYYPGATERINAALAEHPEAETFGSEVSPTLITNIPSDGTNEYCFNEELFCSVLTQTTIPGDNPSSYLKNAVDFCNEKLFGTLGATIIVHPKVKKELGKDLGQVVAELHYGSIGINVWNAAAYLLPQSPWGAYPGHTLDDIQSGIGVVHSSFLLEKTEKTVVRGSFYSFPRGLLHFDFSMLPKPPWFVTNKTSHITGKRVALYTIDKKISQIPGIFVSALRG
jgi:aldehyde dehydrogenase (NAD(P)+)